MTVGATTVVHRRPQPGVGVRADRPSTRSPSPALVNALAKVWAQACEWEPVLPTSLRLVQVGGSRMTAEDARFIVDNLTPGLQQVFGMAEGHAELHPPRRPRRGGRPHPGPADVAARRDAGGRRDTAPRCAPGEEGELLVRGPYTLNGYYRADDANARSFSPGRLLPHRRPGADLRRRPRNGYVEVTGRIKDVIHRGRRDGVSVGPRRAPAHPPGDLARRRGRAARRVSSAKRSAPQSFSVGPPLTLAELNGYLDDRGVSAHARPDVLVATAVASDDGGRQGRQEAGRKAVDALTREPLSRQPLLRLCGETVVLGRLCTGVNTAISVLCRLSRGVALHPCHRCARQWCPDPS